MVLLTLLDLHVGGGRQPGNSHENDRALDMVSGDVKMAKTRSLEPFQDEPKWEMPDNHFPAAPMKACPFHQEDFP